MTTRTARFCPRSEHAACKLAARTSKFLRPRKTTQFFMRILRSFISFYFGALSGRRTSSLIAAVKSSHAKLNTSLPLSSLELAPAQLRGTMEWHRPASGGHQRGNFPPMERFAHLDAPAPKMNTVCLIACLQIQVPALNEQNLNELQAQNDTNPAPFLCGHPRMIA